MKVKKMNWGLIILTGGFKFMVRRFNIIRWTIFLIIICMLVLIPTSSAGNNGVEAHIWLNDVNDFPDSETGYVTSEPEFTLYITNQNNDEGAERLIVIISLPGHEEGVTPSQSIEITKDGTTTIINTTDWEWGTPSTVKADNSTYNMPPSGGFPTYFAYYDMGPIGSKKSGNNLISADVVITGVPTVRFDGWGENYDTTNERWYIILKNPFSHFLQYIPEFPTIALPIAAIVGIMFILQRRKGKED